MQKHVDNGTFSLYEKRDLRAKKNYNKKLKMVLKISQ